MVRKWHWKKELRDGIKTISRKGIVIWYYDIDEDDTAYVLNMKEQGHVLLDKRYNIIE